MMSKRLLVILIIMVAAVLASTAAHARNANSDPLMVCHRAIIETEYQERLPARLLEAIALTESARRDPETNKIVAWPWTVMAEGQGRYFDSKKEAMAAVRHLQAKGVKNIDVGCMQVNLFHHKAAFKNLDEAFDPKENVSYAARFLRGLYEEQNSWVKAIGNYHSRTDKFHARYRDKVLSQWRKTKTGGGADIALRRGKNEPTTAASSASLPAPVLHNISSLKQRDKLMETRRASHLRVLDAKGNTVPGRFASVSTERQGKGIIYRYRYMEQ
jgi:hypothetical protein